MSTFNELDVVRSKTNPDRLGTVLSLRRAGGLRVSWHDDPRNGQTVRDEDVELVRAAAPPRSLPGAVWRIGMKRYNDLPLPTFAQARDRDSHPDQPPAPPAGPTVVRFA